MVNKASYKDIVEALFILKKECAQHKKVCNMCPLGIGDTCLVNNSIPSRWDILEKPTIKIMVK